MHRNPRVRFRTPSAIRLAASAALLFPALTGCGPQAPPPQSGAQTRQELTGGLREPIRLEEIHIKATGDREGVAITAYDASGLFERATTAFRAERFRDAAEAYSQLVIEFPDSPLAPSALYNSGLSRERLGDFEAASRDYLGLAADFASSPDVTDALFRAGGALEKIEAWDDAIRVFGRILAERPDLGTADRVEGLARRGSCLAAIGKTREARLDLDEATLLFRTGPGITDATSTFYYAMAQFKLGELLHSEMRAAELPADEAILQEALERKCQLLLDAQAEYTKAIKILHPHWAAAAAYRIGGLYRNLWDDMLAAPTPEGLSEEERQIYRAVLMKKIRVLLTKAIAQWERTLKMIRRLDLDGEWAERTERDLEEIRKLTEIVESETAGLPDDEPRDD